MRVNDCNYQPSVPSALLGLPSRRGSVSRLSTSPMHHARHEKGYRARCAAASLRPQWDHCFDVSTTWVPLGPIPVICTITSSSFAPS